MKNEFFNGFIFVKFMKKETILTILGFIYIVPLVLFLNSEWIDF
jgi:hypothetical protein